MEEPAEAVIEEEADKISGKLDYSKNLFLHIDRTSKLASTIAESDQPLGLLRGLAWNINTLEAMLNPYLDTNYKVGYEAALTKKEEQKKNPDNNAFDIEAAFTITQLGLLMGIMHRKGLLLKETYTDSIQPRKTKEAPKSDIIINDSTILPK